jgi:hypothetical protein
MLSRNEFVRAYVSRFGASVRRANLKYTKARAHFGMHQEEDDEEAGLERFQPVEDVSRGIVEVNDPGCIHLPPFMHDIIRRAKDVFDVMFLGSRLERAGEGVYFPLMMEPFSKQYVFGICGTFNMIVDFVLEPVCENERFHACYIRTLHLSLREDGSIQFVEADFHEFCDNDQYQVALFSTYTPSEGAHGSHARLMVKQYFSQTIYITDPHGNHEINISDADGDRIVNYLERRRREKPKFRYVRFETQHPDQGMEGSCGALSFLRMIYIVYKSYMSDFLYDFHTRRVVRGHPASDFLDDPIPCTFAVFLSRLFQEARIITRDTYYHGLEDVRVEYRRQLARIAAVTQQQQSH